MDCYYLQITVNKSRLKRSAVSHRSKPWKVLLQTSSNGIPDEISDATSSSHMLSVDDIGFFISVSCEPIRSDWARGPIVLSEQVGPIVPGTTIFGKMGFTFLSMKTLGSVAHCLTICFTQEIRPKLYFPFRGFYCH